MQVTTIGIKKEVNEAISGELRFDFLRKQSSDQQLLFIGTRLILLFKIYFEKYLEK